MGILELNFSLSSKKKEKNEKIQIPVKNLVDLKLNKFIDQQHF